LSKLQEKILVLLRVLVNKGLHSQFIISTNTMLITMEAGKAVILKVLANCISITDHFLKEVLQGVI